MAIYRGNVKVAGVGKGFNPENEGVEGQFLKKTSTGYAFYNIPEAGADHLEVKAPVGELYQLTDTMFLQNTPTLSNSTVEQKVGDTADNTQIHIQRIASGTGSNELKLKVKKVGTPGDLSVQVMKGVQVTVTANVEAYWYGDSNNVLATGSISASSITTSRQEITVTLNNQVGGTEGELLDIVLSIPTVNASNYVIIGCDSTQWSEGFSFVAVNGNTRTRSKIMPYCISDGFTQYMLVKVSDSTVTGYGGLEYTIPNSEKKYVPYNQTQTIEIPFLENIQGNFTANYELYYQTTSTTSKISVNLKLNTTSLFNGTWSQVDLGKKFTGSINLSSGNDLKFVHQITANTDYSNYNYWIVKNIKLTLVGNITISKTIFTHKSLPRELKSLGNKAAATLFGIHIDNTRFSGE